MAALFRYELKKIASRRAVWLVLPLAFAFMLYANLSPIKSALNGCEEGRRDVFLQYEGRAATDALIKEAEAAFAQYAISHSGQYQPIYDEYQGTVSYTAKTDGYYAGVERAYEAIIGMETAESLSRELESARKTLQLGKGGNGDPLSAELKQDLEAKVKYGFDMPVVQNLAGWQSFGRTMGDGYFALFALILGLLPVFTQESAGKMEGVLLASRRRGRAAFGKALAAAVFALAAAIAIYGFEVLLTALIHGLRGAALPVSAVYGWFRESSLTVGGFYTLALLAAVLAAVASGMLVALASSLFRHPLPALLVTAALIAAQFLPGLLVQGIAGDQSYGLLQFANMLPAPALASPWQWLDSLKDAEYAAFALALPASLTAFVFAFSPRHFIRQRKA